MSANFRFSTHTPDNKTIEFLKNATELDEKLYQEAVLQQIKHDLNKVEATQILADTGLNITDMPNGLDTALGELNEALSIGQRRKVASCTHIDKT